MFQQFCDSSHVFLEKTCEVWWSFEIQQKNKKIPQGDLRSKDLNQRLQVEEKNKQNNM